MNTRATVGCKHIVLIVVIQTIAFGVAELRDGTHQDHADLYKDPNASENAPSCLKGDKIIGPLKCTEPRCHRNLTRLEGGELGRKQKIELVCGEEHYLKTVNMKPLIFEIDNFLSDEECEHIKNLALMEGLESSQTKQQGRRKVVMKDFNHDEQLSLHEVIYFHLFSEIENFLSSAECENIMKLAEGEGLDTSITKQDQHGKLKHRVVSLKDFNQDNILSLTE
uniref:Transmembrane prolyl 4-hydroxylase-like n=1 Tax=Saccoglossus kowalevskii TaxID=10224 RepID=A0ABM0M5P9_SACKO